MGARRGSTGGAGGVGGERLGELDGHLVDLAVAVDVLHDHRQPDRGGLVQWSGGRERGQVAGGVSDTGGVGGHGDGEGADGGVGRAGAFGDGERGGGGGDGRGGQRAAGGDGGEGPRGDAGGVGGEGLGEDGGDAVDLAVDSGVGRRQGHEYWCGSVGRSGRRPRRQVGRGVADASGVVARVTLNEPSAVVGGAGAFVEVEGGGRPRDGDRREGRGRRWRW